jgi:hypothetical protein
MVAGPSRVSLRTAQDQLRSAESGLLRALPERVVDAAISYCPPVSPRLDSSQELVGDQVMGVSCDQATRVSQVVVHAIFERWST